MLEKLLSKYYNVGNIYIRNEIGDGLSTVRVPIAKELSEEYDFWATRHARTNDFSERLAITKKLNLISRVIVNFKVPIKQKKERRPNDRQKR